MGEILNWVVFLYVCAWHHYRVLSRLPQGGFLHIIDVLILYE